jgi:hypothetical protein
VDKHFHTEDFSKIHAGHLTPHEKSALATLRNGNPEKYVVPLDDRVDTKMKAEAEDELGECSGCNCQFILGSATEIERV